jgi:hypothetical protein
MKHNKHLAIDPEIITNIVATVAFKSPNLCTTTEQVTLHRMKKKLARINKIVRA